MSRLEHYITNYDRLDELAAYTGNLGFMELTEFYNKADKTEIAKLEKLIKNDDWEGFKRIIQQVIGVKLK